MHRSLPRSTPSAQNVDAAAVSDFITALESAENIEPHSLMLLRNGQVISEGWWAPYSADRVHLLYSLSKSFTSTAIGLAVDDGLLTLDDTVISHFPELDGEITDPRSRTMTVGNILSMASGHREETLQRALEIDPIDLVRGFLLVPPDDEPGTVFAYNQPCTYTAARIVERVTGQSLLDFLRPRLFDPLGIDDLGWLRDESGQVLGFSGLHAQTEAIAALGQLYLQRGEWDSRQLVSTAWVDDATRVHVSNGTDPASDWEQGYGFQFWMARNGYRGDGAYGQFCVILPEHDVVLAMTGQSEDMQGVLTLAWKHLLPAFTSATTAGASVEADAALAGHLESLALSPVATSTITRRVEPGTFVSGPDSTVTSLVRIELGAGDDEGAQPMTLTLVDHDGRIDVTPGFGEWVTNGATAASIGWDRDGIRLMVDVIFIETPHRMHLVLDTSTATFGSSWATVPLHEPRLTSLRKPTD